MEIFPEKNLIQRSWCAKKISVPPQTRRQVSATVCSTAPLIVFASGLLSLYNEVGIYNAWAAIEVMMEAHSTHRGQPPKMHGSAFWKYGQKAIN